MKQAFLAIKRPMLMLLLLAVTGSLSAQSCYQNFLQKGKSAFESFQFEKAIKNFEAAKVCDDRPDSPEAEEWVAKAQNGYIDRLQLIASKYLTSEGQRAFQQKNYGTAFRLYQEALKYKNDNIQAKNLLEQMLLYMADYQYNIEIDNRFYHPDQVVLKGSDLLVVFDKNKENNNAQIKLIDPGSRAIKQSFEIEGSLSNYQFSEDGKWLAVEFYDAKEKQVNLSLWEVESGQLIHTFNQIYSREPYKAFQFSENGEKLVYRTEEVIEKISLKISTGSDDLVADTLRESAYSLSVYDLLSRKSIFTTEGIIDYYIDSPENVFSFYRRAPIGQNLINEKISMKFSTRGVITTNNQNFVIKENEFRIRESNDFAISPDGKKFTYLKYSEEALREINFSTEINFESPPKTLIGNINVIDLEADSSIFFVKSEYEELPQRFLPFGFGKNSKHFIFIKSRKWTGWNFNKETDKIELTESHFILSFNIYNLEKQHFIVEENESTYDYFITQNNLLVNWSGGDIFKRGYLRLYDLNRDTLIFSQNKKNDFSHFYDVKSNEDLVYFSTFNPNTSKTTKNVLDTNLDSITSLKDDFVSLDYTYLRTSPDQNKIAFLTDGGYMVSVWDLKNQQPIREIKCQSQIAEFDFSNDTNFLIIRDKNNLVKIIDLSIPENIYDYFDNFYEQLTAEEKENFGIDW